MTIGPSSRDNPRDNAQAQQPEQAAGALPATRVAVIGTGTMGAAVTRRLLGAGVVVDVWNRSPEPTRELAALGARAHTDPSRAVDGAPVVVTLLPTAEVVREVMIERDVIDALAPGTVWAQMGTIGLEATTALDAEVLGRRPDVRFVDAPVSGSRVPAETGQLVVLASGPDEARAIIDPVFSVLGRRTLWLGNAGVGTAMKLVLNTWLAFEIEAAAEAAAIASRLGIAGDVLADTVAGSPLVSPLAGAKLTKMLAADDHPDFSLGWALKDLELAEAVADPGTIPVAASIAHRWRTLAERGLAGLDVSAARFGLGGEPAGDGRP